jgi:hypothetical protein
MSSANKIILKGMPEEYDEVPAGNGLIKPGHLTEIYNVAGVKTCRKHSVYGGATDCRIAIEDSLQGKTVDEAYSTNDPVRQYILEPGDVAQMRLPAAAVAVVFGDKLISNGDGTLIKSPSSASHTLYSSVAASAAVTNTATETAFDKSYTIPANTLVVGDVLTIRGEGIATATHSTDTLKITVKIGTTVLVATALVDVADNDIFDFEVNIEVRTIGASGTFVAYGYTSIGASGTVNPISFTKGSTAIDTTATQALTVTAKWSVADVGNSVRLDALDVERAAVTPQAPALFMAVENVDNSGGSGEAFIAAQAL